LSLTTRKIADGIFLVRFDSQYELAATFLRIQEHYESSRFRNRVFTLEQYMDWYVAQFGAFTYFDDWSGFNVPSTAFRAFYRGAFDPLTKKEERLLGRFRKQRRPFYVIGIASPADLRHELAHALFFTQPDYKAAVLAAMRGHQTAPLRRALARMGYHRDVLTDEVHAYLVAPAGALGRAKALAPLRKEVRAIFRRYSAALTLPRSLQTRRKQSAR
jgi:hypothetical protein